MITRTPKVSLSFVGSVGGFERPLIVESAVSFTTYDEVRAGPLHGVGLLRIVLSLFQLAFGTFQALVLMLRRRPQALLLTGGWVGLPVAVAAWLFRVPSMIFVPDIEPGLSIRVLRRFARRVALTVADSRSYFSGQSTVVTGYPVRAQMRSASRSEALAFFGLDPARRTLLVFGGSRGARAINNALLDILPQLLDDGAQIIHLTGTLDWDGIDAQRKKLPDAAHYHAFPYLHREMGLAMAAADLVVSRAGASILGEFPLFRLPAVLIPYPHAWRYQKVNADYLSSRGAAVRLDEDKLSSELLPLIRSLLNDPKRLDEMRAASAALALPDAADHLARELTQLAGGQV
jgi:UDP-N-acetylglucosamine--N-acetylmuramyl-(pentapeptide) pyrophosphoryl-undecaprenol N-acetylglucosamine transferase